MDPAAQCLAYCGRLDSLAGWHGDDFYTEGEPGALGGVDEMILGPGASTEGTILRRILRWSTEGVHMVPDAKHVENLASLLEVKGAKPSRTPSSRATGRGQRDVLELLTAARFDLQFATKEPAQDMQTPSKLSMLRLRRFVPYLLGAADVGPFFAYQDEPNTVLVWTDADWSGNAVTCKSTSAGAVQLGSRTIETWSVNQQLVPLSSAESDLYAIGSGCARGLTVKHVLLEILHTASPDSDVKMTICTDSDAARGMVHRVGCGRMRHLQTRYLWHQQALREGQFNVVRCGTRENPSDLGTKVLERGDGDLHEQARNRPREHFAGFDRCSLGTSDQCERRNDCGWVLFETSGKHNSWSCEHGRLGLHIRGECWGRRICRGYDTGLAGGHEQVQWVESADAVQRWGAVECVRTNVEQCAQMVRQRISHNRSTLQVTDQGLPGEHKECCVWRRKRGLQ